MAGTYAQLSLNSRYLRFGNAQLETPAFKHCVMLVGGQTGGSSPMKGHSLSQPSPPVMSMMSSRSGGTESKTFRLC